VGRKIQISNDRSWDDAGRTLISRPLRMIDSGKPARSGGKSRVDHRGGGGWLRSMTRDLPAFRSLQVNVGRKIRTGRSEHEDPNRKIHTKIRTARPNPPDG